MTTENKDGAAIKELNEAIEAKKEAAKPTKAELQAMHKQEQASKKAMLDMKKRMIEETQMFQIESQRMGAEIEHHEVRMEYAAFMQKRYDDEIKRKEEMEAQKSKKAKSSIIQPNKIPNMVKV